MCHFFLSESHIRHVSQGQSDKSEHTYMIFALVVDVFHLLQRSALHFHILRLLFKSFFHGVALALLSLKNLILCFANPAFI